MIFDAIDNNQPFALLEKNGVVRCFQGAVHTLAHIDEIDSLARKTGRDVVFVLPYRVIRERGFEAIGDEPILALAVETAIELPKQQVIVALPQPDLALAKSIEPEQSDDAYAQMVRRCIETEIDGGNASQVTLSRVFTGRLKDFNTGAALALYRRCLHQVGHYMAVLFANIQADAAESSYIVGCTPERHLEIYGNSTVMTPIAGTLRKEDRESFESRLDSFLNDSKEINELFQVVDEEMKMMGLICPRGGEVEGPFLREVGAVIHTEYNLVGKRGGSTMQALRRTLHAPTVMGSPMESAARIIKNYENQSRRYYAGEIGIYRAPQRDAPIGDLDCAILIRSAECSGDGTVRVQAGGGIVRDSDPMNEARESRAKAQGLIGLLTGPEKLQTRYLTPELMKNTEEKLKSRNAHLSHFWMLEHSEIARDIVLPGHHKICIVNNEDDFAFMIGHLLTVMGAEVTICDTFDYDISNDLSDVLILGPGPGDPMDMQHKRMRRMQEIIAAKKTAHHPILGICLGHQALAVSLGIPVLRQSVATQGMQRTVTIGEKNYHLGFYNSFSPIVTSELTAMKDITFDVDEGQRVIAMYGSRFIGYQFHPESVMSERGWELLRDAILTLNPPPIL